MLGNEPLSLPSSDDSSVATLHVPERELMYRVKSKNSMCQKLQNKVRMHGRLVLIVSLILAASLYVTLFMGNGSRVGTTSPSVVPKDRSGNYKVKVLPDHLDDEGLHALPKMTFSYLAMIDAGSSGCRAHVYRYGKLGSLEGPLYVLPQHVSKKVKPGLSSFAAHPNDAGASLAGLIEFIKLEVPEADWTVTPIWLKATAGLRMLEKQQSEAIMNSVRTFLGNKANSPFLFRHSWAKIISGNEEGGFGWIAYNYLRKIIGPKKSAVPQLPYAVVEMGGASSQVSQMAPTQEEADKIPEEYKFSFTIEGDTYHLYTHSYLGFGAEQGREQLNKLLTKSTIPTDKGEVIKDPCLNTGFSRPGTVPRKETYEGPQGVYFNVTGAADASGICKNAMSNIFGSRAEIISCEKDKTGPHSFGCTYQPSFVADSKNFLLFENFFYLSSAIGVKPVIDPQLAAAAAPGSVPAGETVAKIGVFPLVTTPHHMLEATNEVCSLQYSSLEKQYPVDSQPKDVNTKMCFIGSYSYSFLTHGLKIPKNKHVTIQKDVGNSEIEWALGAAYKETADFLKHTNLRPT
jgi:apyrase